MNLKRGDIVTKDLSSKLNGHRRCRMSFPIYQGRRKLTAGGLLIALVCLTRIFNATASAQGGVLVIAYMDESKVVLVDSNTYQTLAMLETGKNPHEVRVSHDRRRAYVAAGKSITAVDLQQRKVKATFDLGSFSAHDIRVSRDGRRIWAACAGAQTILELDADTGKILKTYKTEQQGSWFVEITPDERKIYTPNLEGKSVSVINRATGQVKIIRFANPVYGIDITPDGKQVWVSGGDLAVIDTASDEVIARIKTSEAETGRIRITSDGKKLVVALLKKLAVFNVKTRQLMSETELGSSPKVLTLSADNRRAFLTNPDDNSVSVVDIVAGKQLTTFPTGKKPDGIGWAN
jgi:DNA-binding beta-propeller fold protein YncE